MDKHTPITSSNDDAASCLESMFQSKSIEIPSVEDRIYSIMSDLESLADNNKNKALSLMSALSPLASNLMMHDVCDSIDLWIYHNNKDNSQR